MPKKTIDPIDAKIRADWSKLTEKQQEMIHMYLRTGNKLGSYKHAYNVRPDTRKGTIVRNCYAEFKKPHIKAIIDQIQTKAVRDAKMTVERDFIDGSVEDMIEDQKDIEALKVDALWILKRAVLLADFNINRFIAVHNGNAVYDFTDATDDDWYCISEYTADTIERGTSDDENRYLVDKVKLKGYDKIRSLELVARFLPEEETQKDKDPLAQLADAFKKACENRDKITVD